VTRPREKSLVLDVNVVILLIERHNMDLNTFYNNDYISVVVTHFTRFEDTKRLIESLEKYADMPYELIIHCDGSPDGSDEKIYELKDKISTLIINTNTEYNVGLATSIDRCVRVATSKYILFMNNDCSLLTPCFKDIKNVLDKEYVGFITFFEDNPEEVNEYIENNGTKFVLKPGLGHGSIISFCKSFYEFFGGVEHYQSGCSDTPIFYKSFNSSKFRAGLLGKKKITNHAIDEGRRDSSIGQSKHDCCFPKLFNKEDFDEMCHKREEYCNRQCNQVNSLDSSFSNLGYWNQYNNDLFSGNSVFNINWEEGKKHGQFQWKEMVLQDVRKIHD
jgi:glycosyltransferase involved in cell wall biosynthesis